MNKKQESISQFQMDGGLSLSGEKQSGKNLSESQEKQKQLQQLNRLALLKALQQTADEITKD